MSDTPRTDEAALGFARILVDKESGSFTELVDADFARDLERENARLREALEPLAKIPVEEFGKQDTPNQPLMGWNYHTIYVRDVLAARAALKGEGK